MSEAACVAVSKLQGGKRFHSSSQSYIAALLITQAQHFLFNIQDDED